MVSLRTLGQTVLAGLCLISPALADIELGDMKSSYAASDQMDITWKDDGESPSISQFSTLTILLCTGPNANIHCFSDTPLSSGVAASAGKYSVDLSKVSSLGASGPYYLQVVAIAAGQTGDQTIHYSDRFKLTGMTGLYKPTDGGDTDPPDAQKENADPVAGGSTVAYTAQTGKVRTAPMQLQPGTKVTVTKATPLYPTSAVTYFSTYAGRPSQTTTLTPSWSYTVSTYPNFAATKTQPKGYAAAKPTSMYSRMPGIATQTTS